MKECNRRTFLLAASGVAALGQRVAGAVLVHEHILVDFIGADQVSRARYDAGEAFRAARPHLEALREFGVVRLQECTPNFLGRDPALLRRLEEATGIEMWTNTGLYAARNFVFLPGYARTETAAQLAARWVREAREGVEGMKPRFIKIGVDKGPLPSLSRKIVEAAALASAETGLPVCAHTGDGAAAEEELAILTARGVKPEKFVWVHAQNEKDHAVHERVAKAGAWVEFDGIGPRTMDWHLECVRHMAGKGLLGRVLISQDAGWYRVGEPGGGAFRGYTEIFTSFVPQLAAGEAEQLLVKNPRAAFSVS
jgi:phosphotriesterase-related protein